MKELTAEDIQSIIESNKKVVIDFFGDNCGACMEIAPSYEKLSEEHANKAEFYKFNVSGKRRVAMGYGIMGVPTIVVFEDGKKKDQIAGSIKPNELEVFLVKNL